MTDQVSARATAVSLRLNDIGTVVDNALRDAAGKPVSFVLALSIDDSTQYISNTGREGEIELLTRLLKHWLKEK